MVYSLDRRGCSHFWKQSVFYFVRFMQKVLFFFAHNGYMSHLSSRLRLLFTVNMNKGIIDLHYIFKTLIFHVSIATFSADDIYHDRWQNRISISQGVAKNQSPKHIKLAAIMRFNSVMPAVVNPRSCFIY